MMTSPAAALRTLAAFCAVFLVAGCATTGNTNAEDPYEAANRQVYAFNRGIDKAALKPVAKVYEANVPQWMRNSVANFFHNMEEPVTIVNQLLQGKLKLAGQDTLRFAMNTTLGVGGLFDPARDANLQRHDEDLGQTLGRWGVPAGPYLMLPFLGPAHVRDVPSVVVDRFLQPIYWYNAGNERWISLGLSLVDKRSRLLPLDAALERTYDQYGFIRQAYSQRRLFQVYDGNVPEDMLPKEENGLDEEMDDPEAEPGAEAQPD